MPSRPTNRSDDNPDYIETMKRGGGYRGKEGDERALKESYSERRKTMTKKN
jgi:hypothetical protein